MPLETTLLIIVFFAGLYMAWNIGANDVANAVGTSVGSGALRLSQAVLIAAIFEFCGAYFFGSYVTNMVQNGIVEPTVFTKSPQIFVFGMLSSLLAAGIWLQIASYFGWPVSTTHSIIGAILGFGAIVGGFDAVHWDNVIYITGGWIFSPLIGGVLGYLIFNIIRKNILYAPCPVTSAKKLTPWIVFVFISTLTIITMFKGLKNVSLNLNFFQTILLSIMAGGIAALISNFCVSRIKTPPGELRESPDFNPQAITEIEKAQKHLKLLRKQSSGETSYKVTLLLEGIDKLAKDFKKREMIGSSDYATVEKIFGYLQIMSACLMAFSHGANDVANAIGPLSAAVVVITTGVVVVADLPVQPWALALGGFGIILGLATWGWRVIETIGKKLTELTPSRGFSAEFGAALTIVFASRMGLPVSTTHILVGAVLGVGMARGIEALNLNTTRDIIVSWIVTVPAGAGISIGCYYLLDFIFA